MAVPVLQMVQLSAPLGWGQRSPPQETRPCVALLGSEWIMAHLPQGFQLLLHSSHNDCSFLTYSSAVLFANTPDMPRTCSLLSWAWALLTGEKAGSGQEGMGAQLSGHRYDLCSHSTVHNLVHVTQIPSWSFISAQWGDLAATLPLFLNTSLLKLADFPNSVPISNEEGMRESSWREQTP